MKMGKTVMSVCVYVCKTYSTRCMHILLIVARTK